MEHGGEPSFQKCFIRSHGVFKNFEPMFKNEEIVPKIQLPDSLENK